MKILVIYDSYFGNTEKIAHAIAERCGKDAAVLKAGEALEKNIQEAAFLIVGSPTRGFRPTESISAFIGSLAPNGLQGKSVAAFDTRISADDIKQPLLRKLVRLFRYAAPAIAKGLVIKGGLLAGEPEGFYVKDTEGPLREGEIERAREWARGLCVDREKKL